MKKNNIKMNLMEFSLVCNIIGQHIKNNHDNELDRNIDIELYRNDAGIIEIHYFK